MDANTEKSDDKKPDDRSSWVGAVEASRQSDRREQPWREDMEHNTRPRNYLTVDEVIVASQSEPNAVQTTTGQSTTIQSRSSDPPPRRANPPIPTT
ncbi:hypothetical protein THAR02_10492 [Trichoderma harzianum]|uniref:Uncharacterized protein n=1 Tax=Trichoderma harzianum TaxID=5544 RepID=A0A0F9WY68_TRIHA|nr:hypothetical protein THAR02_10492 [Trichoderma harzianum]